MDKTPQFISVKSVGKKKQAVVPTKQIKEKQSPTALT